MNAAVLCFNEIGWFGIHDCHTSLLTEPEAVSHLLEAYLLNELVCAGALRDTTPNIGLCNHEGVSSITDSFETYSITENSIVQQHPFEILCRSRVVCRYTNFSVYSDRLPHTTRRTASAILLQIGGDGERKRHSHQTDHYDHHQDLKRPSDTG